MKQSDIKRQAWLRQWTGLSAAALMVVVSLPMSRCTCSECCAESGQADAPVAVSGSCGSCCSPTPTSPAKSSSTESQGCCDACEATCASTVPAEAIPLQRMVIPCGGVAAYLMQPPTSDNANPAELPPTKPHALDVCSRPPGPPTYLLIESLLI